MRIVAAQPLIRDDTEAEKLKILPGRNDVHAPTVRALCILVSSLMRPLTEPKHQNAISNSVLRMTDP